MTDLLTRLRAASEPSRQLDAEIHAFRMDWKFKRWVERREDPYDDHKAYADFHGPEIEEPEDNYVPHYTSNLQDALELVPVDPETGLWSINMEIHSAATFVCMKPPDGNYGYYVNDCPNPALALATAAIEAKMKLSADEAGAGKEG